MKWSSFWLVFFALFLAEIGDKTQLAVIGFTTSQKSPLLVFFASSFALILSTFLAVLFGSALLKIVPIKVIHLIAGLLLFAAGIFTIVQTLR